MSSFKLGRKTIEKDARRLQVLLSRGQSGNGGVTDHGDLTGLGDDDHPQYAAIAAPALPEESSITSSIRSSRTFDTSTDAPRSLYDPVANR